MRDFRSWFDSPIEADVLLHVCCQPCDTQHACSNDSTTVAASAHPAPEAPSPGAGIHAGQPSLNDGIESPAAAAAAAQPGACHQTPNSQRQAGGSEDSGADTGNGRKRQAEPGSRGNPTSSTSKRTCKRDATAAAAQQQQPARSYLAHAIVLRAQSEYFNASLGNWQPQKQRLQRNSKRASALGVDSSATRNAQPATTEHHRELTLTIQPDEQEAMDLLLRFMYGFDLPAASPSTTLLLLQCLRLADSFHVPHCVDAVLAHLTHIAPDPAVLDFACTAPPGIVLKPDFQRILGNCKDTVHQQFKQPETGRDPVLLDACKRFIVQTYGDVSEVMGSDRPWREFCTLPFGAVLAWAESDELQVLSENCVVYLLSAWVKAALKAGGQRVSSAQLEQLCQQVRVLHLGPAYQHQVLPQLEWFKRCSGMQHLATLQTFKGKDAAGKAIFPAAGIDFPVEDRGFPQPWVAQPRKPARVTEAGQLLTWEVGGEQLQELYEGKCVFSPFLHMNGYVLGIGAAEFDAGGAKSLSLCMAASLGPAVTGTYGHARPQNVHAHCGSFELRVVNHAGIDVCESNAQGVMKMGRAWGKADMLCKSAPTMSELLAPYLREGKLCLQARFTTVDQA